MKHNVVFSFSLLALICLMSFSGLTFGSNLISSGLSLHVCILNMPLVENHLVANQSLSVEGALDASNISKVCFANWETGVKNYGEQANITTEVVTDWDRYAAIVENESNVVFVNAHADVLPVPSNYSKEDWVAKIAEAIIYRNVTWVHTGGFPFYYTQTQGENISVWGLDGFANFSTIMGMTNLAIVSIDSSSCESLDSQALFPTWDSALAFYAQGYYLNATESQDKIVCPIWGDNSYPMGAVFKTAGDGLGTTGFYVHLGASNVLDSTYHAPVSNDYVRSYIGTAQAIYCLALRSVMVTEISGAAQQNNTLATNLSTMWPLVFVLFFSIIAGFFAGHFGRRK